MRAIDVPDGCSFEEHGNRLVFEASTKSIVGATGWALLALLLGSAQH